MSPAVSSSARPADSSASACSRSVCPVSSSRSNTASTGAITSDVSSRCSRRSRSTTSCSSSSWRWEARSRSRGICERPATEVAELDDRLHHPAPFAKQVAAPGLGHPARLRPRRRGAGPDPRRGVYARRGSPRSGQTLKERPVLLEVAVAEELVEHPPARGGPEPGRQLGVGEQALDRAAERRQVVRVVEQQAVPFVLDLLGDAADRARDDRRAPSTSPRSRSGRIPRRGSSGR